MEPPSPILTGNTAKADPRSDDPLSCILLTHLNGASVADFPSPDIRPLYLANGKRIALAGSFIIDYQTLS